MVQKVRNATYSIVVYRILVTLAWLFAFFEVFTSEGTRPFSRIGNKLYLYGISVRWYLGVFLAGMVVYYIWVALKMGFDLNEEKRVFTVNAKYRAYLLGRSSNVMESYYKFRYCTLVDSFIFILKTLLIVSLFRGVIAHRELAVKAIIIIGVHYLLEKRERVNLERVDINLWKYFGILLSRDDLGEDFEIINQDIMSDFSVLYTILDKKTGVRYWIKR